MAVEAHVGRHVRSSLGRAGALPQEDRSEEMFMNAQRHLPPITIATCDHNRLLVTAMIQQEHNRRASEFLLEELRRAKFVIRRRCRRISSRRTAA